RPGSAVDGLLGAGGKADGGLGRALPGPDDRGRQARAVARGQPFRPLRPGAAPGPGRGTVRADRPGTVGRRGPQLRLSALRRGAVAGAGHPGLLSLPRPGRPRAVHARGLPRRGARTGGAVPGVWARPEPALRPVAGDRGLRGRHWAAVAVMGDAAAREPAGGAW